MPSPTGLPGSLSTTRKLRESKIGSYVPSSTWPESPPWQEPRGLTGRLSLCLVPLWDWVLRTKRKASNGLLPLFWVLQLAWPSHTLRILLCLPLKGSGRSHVLSSSEDAKLSNAIVHRDSRGLAMLLRVLVALLWHQGHHRKRRKRMTSLGRCFPVGGKWPWTLTSACSENHPCFLKQGASGPVLNS